MSLKFLQKPLSHLLLLHLQNWFRRLMPAVWNIPHHLHHSLQTHSKHLRRGAGITLSQEFSLEPFMGKVRPKQNLVLTVAWVPLLDTFLKTVVKESSICFYQDVVWPFFPRSSKGCLSQFHDVSKTGAGPVLWSNFIRVRPERGIHSHWAPARRWPGLRCLYAVIPPPL